MCSRIFINFVSNTYFSTLNHASVNILEFFITSTIANINYILFKINCTYIYNYTGCFSKVATNF